MSRLRVLGTFSLTADDGRTVPVRAAKQRALLALLAVRSASPLTQDDAAAMLWQGHAKTAARHSLRQATSAIRIAAAAVGVSDPIAISRGGIRLADEVDTDVQAVDRPLVDGDVEGLKRALEHYCGQFAEGIDVRGDRFDAWRLAQRQRLAARAANLAVMLSRALAEHDDAEAGLAAARRALEIDPTDEAAYRRLIEMLIEAGDRGAAVRAYRSCTAALREKFGVEPEQETQALGLRLGIVAIDGSGRPAPGATAAAEGDGSTRPPAAPGEVERPTRVGIFPFVPLDASPRTVLIAAGLTQDLLVLLAKLPGLEAIDERGGAAIADRGDTDIDVALSGTIQSEGDRLRIQVKLTDCSTRRRLWGERFDRAGDDLFAIQDEVALVTATALQVELTEGAQARIRSRKARSLEAWLQLVQAMPMLRTLNREDLRRSRKLAEEALAIDPDFAAAWAHVGWIHLAEYRSGWSSDPVRSLADTQSAARRAIELDPGNPDAHMVLGGILLLEGRYAEAIEIRRRGIAVNPNHADLRACISATLHFSGQDDEAIHQSAVAVRLCPRRPTWYPLAGAMARRLAGDRGAALGILRRIHRDVPDNLMSTALLIATAWEAGEAGEARSAAASWSAAHGDIDLDLAVDRWLPHIDQAVRREIARSVRRASE